MKHSPLKLISLLAILSLAGCSNGLWLKSNIVNETTEGKPIVVQGDILVSHLNYKIQKYYSIIETPPDTIIDSEYYFLNTSTLEKIYPADAMYVRTTEGLQKMPNIKGYTLVDNETYYNNNLYYVFMLSQTDLLTDCQAKTWNNLTGITYIAEWNKDKKKFIIDHTALYDPKEWNDLDEKSRDKGYPANKYIFEIQHSIPFDCSKSVVQGQALAALQLEKIQ